MYHTLRPAAQCLCSIWKAHEDRKQARTGCGWWPVLRIFARCALGRVWRLPGCAAKRKVRRGRWPVGAGGNLCHQRLLRAGRDLRGQQVEMRLSGVREVRENEVWDPQSEVGPNVVMRDQGGGHRWYERQRDHRVLSSRVPILGDNAGLGHRPVLRLFPPCALISHAQRSSGVVDNMPFAWRGHTQSLATRARPSPDLAVWLE